MCRELRAIKPQSLKKRCLFTGDVADGGVGVLVVQRRRATGERVGQWRAERDDGDAWHGGAQAHHAAQQTANLCNKKRVECEKGLKLRWWRVYYIVLITYESCQDLKC